MKLLIQMDIKSWTPKDVADAAYYPLSENNDGTKILKEDVENFITNVDVTTIGEKTTVVNAHTRSGFDTVRHSSCVDPKNYSEELGKQYAMRYAASLPKLKARNNIYLKLQEVEKKYKNE